MCPRAVDLIQLPACGRYRSGITDILLHSLKISMHQQGKKCVLSGYDPYAGYYAQDGTTYAYDPNAYAAASGAPAEAAVTAPSAIEAPTDNLVAVPAATSAPAISAATATAEADSTATPTDALGSAASLPADSSAAAPLDIGAEHTANLLSVDEKQNLEQQQAAAEIARIEAEERYQKAEEQRRNAKVLLAAYILLCWHINNAKALHSMQSVLLCC